MKSTQVSTSLVFFQFLDLPVLTYNGDKLIRKWQLDFFEERAKFVQEIKKWRQQNIPDI